MLCDEDSSDGPRPQLAGAGATADPVKDYLKQIGKVPLLNAEQEVELAKRIEAGLYAELKLSSGESLGNTTRWDLEWIAEDGRLAKSHMLEANLRLVVSLAKRYTGRGMLFLDLIQEGNLGLIRALEVFDYSQGCRFSTFAASWIRGAITRAMTDTTRIIRLPADLVEAVEELSRVQRQLLHDRGREPTLDELALELDLTPDQVLELRNFGREPISLSTPIDHEGGELSDLIVDADAVDPPTWVTVRQRREALSDVLNTLADREASVVRMRYGLLGDRPRTLDEVGRVFGVSSERIAVLEASAISKLQHPSRSEFLWRYHDGGHSPSQAARGVPQLERDLVGAFFSFTGWLPGLTRAEAFSLVEARGGIVLPTVERRTDYLVVGDGAEPKAGIADQYGVRLLDKDEFVALLDGAALPHRACAAARPRSSSARQEVPGQASGTGVRDRRPGQASGTQAHGLQPDLTTGMHSSPAAAVSAAGAGIEFAGEKAGDAPSVPSAKMVSGHRNETVVGRPGGRDRNAMTFDFDDAAPRSWADAFPWLAGSPGAALVPWSNESIDGTHPEARRLRLAAISDLAIQRLARWTISQVFPGLPPDVNLLLLDLPTRALNILRRFDCSTSVQIMPLTIEEMMDWRNAGVGTIDIILQRLAGLSTSLATPTVTAHPGLVVPRLASPNLPYQVLPDRIASVAGDLRVIATWDALVGQPGQTLLSDARRAGTPRRVLEAHRRLVSLTSAEVLHEAELGLNAADRLNDALGILEPRAIEVLAARFFADSPETLEQLGQAFGVTRERVRQIEGKARGSLLGVISEPGPLADLAQSVRDLISTIRPLDDLVESMPALAQDVELVGQPAWRVLDRLDDAYEVEDGWCVAPTMTSALHLTQTQLQERADQYGVVRLDEIDLIESNNPERLREQTAAWLRYCGFVVDGDFAMLRTSSVGDYAAAVLSIEGSPLSAQEIVDRFAFERAVGSTRNAMSLDERFDRVDRDRWALKEWGLDTYGGIRSVIRELVARSGGRARLNHVIEHITERYSVSSSSVAAYAAAPPFMTKDGIVQLDSGDRTARKAPENTRRIFRRSDGWAYRIRVTADHLRGSGSVAPMAIAAILDLHPGETVQLESPLGPQAVAWTGIQPSFGTIRRFLMDDDVPAGTDGFLVLNEDGTFGFERARDMVGDPLVDALALAGLPADTRREEARLALARAIKLPEDSPVASIIGGYRSRGDEDIADLLLGARHYLEAGEEPPATAPDADIDAIMGLL